MEITCWNCKTVVKLDKAAVEAAIAAMDASKLGFHDVPCASCGKSNRTARDLFVSALEAFNAAPAMTKREATQKTKEENARRRGDEDKKERAKIKEAVKKGKK